MENRQNGQHGSWRLGSLHARWLTEAENWTRQVLALRNVPCGKGARGARGEDVPTSTALALEPNSWRVAGLFFVLWHQTAVQSIHPSWSSSVVSWKQLQLSTLWFFWGTSTLAWAMERRNLEWGDWEKRYAWSEPEWMLFNLCNSYWLPITNTMLEHKVVKKLLSGQAPDVDEIHPEMLTALLCCLGWHNFSWFFAPKKSDLLNHAYAHLQGIFPLYMSTWRFALVDLPNILPSTHPHSTINGQRKVPHDRWCI